MKYYLVILAFSILIACNSGTDKQQEAEAADSTEVSSDTVVSYSGVDTSTEFIQTISNDIKPWLIQTTKARDSSLSKFAYADNWVDDSLIISTQKLEGDFLKTYKTVLVYSPDQKKVLDLGSYGTMVSRNKKGETKIASGEPDSEVAVIDLETNKRRRIFYSGPGTTIDHGFWLNDSTLVLAGKSGEQQADIPILLQVSLREKSNFVRRFEYASR